MKEVLIVLATSMLLLASCSSAASDAQVEEKSLLIKAAQQGVPSKRKLLPQALGQEQIVLVKFTNGSALHWDNHLHTIVSDSLYDAVVATCPEEQPSFIALLSDTTATSAKACNCTEADLPLVIGDVAFLVLHKLKRVAGMQVLGIQWDAFDTDCSYPCGMLSYVQANRKAVRKKVAAYLASTK